MKTSWKSKMRGLWNSSVQGLTSWMSRGNWKRLYSKWNRESMKVIPMKRSCDRKIGSATHWRSWVLKAKLYQDKTRVRSVCLRRNPAKSLCCRGASSLRFKTDSGLRQVVGGTGSTGATSTRKGGSNVKTKSRIIKTRSTSGLQTKCENFT